MKIIFVFLISLTFAIAGKQDLEIFIDGNEYISSSFLDDKIISKYSNTFDIFSTTINKDHIPKIMIDLKKFYLNNGFHKSSFSFLKNDNSVKISIKEGEPLFITNISFSLSNDIKKKEIIQLLDFKLGSRFLDTDLTSSIRNINHYLLKLGYSSPSFQILPILNKKELNINMKIVINKMRIDKISNINIINNTDIKIRNLSSFFYFSKGDTFNIEDIDKTYSSLRSIGSFEIINIKYKRNITGVDINVFLLNKIKNKYRFSLGFDSDEFFRIKLNNRNSFLFDSFTYSDISVKYSNNNSALTHTLSHKLSKKVSISNTIQAIYRKTRLFNYSFLMDELSIGLTNNKFKNRFSLSSQRSSVKDDIVLSTKSDDSLLTSLNYSFNYNDKDDYFNPKKALVSSLSLDYGPKDLNNYDFFNLKFSFSSLLPMSSNNSLFFKYKKNYFHPLSDDAFIPYSFLYSVGGSSNNRSMEFDSVLSRDVNLFTTEIHTHISSNFYFSTFIDYSLFEDIIDLSKYSVLAPGIGLRYKSDIGVFKFDFSSSFSDKNNKTYSNFNFGYGYGF